MLRRCWSLAIVGVFAITIAPAWGQTPAYDKDAVKALSKRIDEHLAKAWKKANVTPAPKADDYAFFRRLHLDLVGHIPELTDIGDFIDDKNADKRWKWVDGLLGENPRYPQFKGSHAQHFGNVWRNIALGYQTNQQFQFLMPQFENWMKDNVEKNVPLDKMVNKLLTSRNAGNGGFNGQQQGSSPQLFFLANENKAENLAGATSRVFLGVKIECAQCHAHPFAKWTKDQFWEFAAFYSQPQNIRQPGKAQQPQPNPVTGREIRIPGTDKIVKAKFLNGQEPKWDQVATSINSQKVLADWVTSPENPYFAKAMADHIWSYLMGVGLLEPIMEPNDDIPMTHPELLNDLAKALIDNEFDAKFLIRAIVHTDAYQRSSGGKKLADKEDYHLFVRMPIRAMSPEQIFDSVVYATTAPPSSTSRLREELLAMPNQQQFFNPNQLASPRAQFMLKYTTQDRRHEPQTSILQALFLMNGKFMAKMTKLENNDSLYTLATQKTPHAQRVRSLYMMVLSRPPRDNETSRLVAYLEKGEAEGRLGDALSDVYWALLNTSEFFLNH
jgi:Protein of unknown function (DUF1553)/Protein of unknown function (DUF1549)